MDKYRLLYIDDDIDTALSEYLDKKLPNSINSTDLALECNELQFIPSEGYKSLLNNASVLTSNIILIDSRLFEDRTASEGKFSGEEFKIILKKYYPFIEVIVITQNEADESVKTFPNIHQIAERPQTNTMILFCPDVSMRLLNKTEYIETWQKE